MLARYYSGVSNERDSSLRSLYFYPSNNYSYVVVDFGGAILLWIFSSKKSMVGSPDRNACRWIVMADMERLFYDHRR